MRKCHILALILLLLCDFCSVTSKCECSYGGLQNEDSTVNASSALYGMESESGESSILIGTVTEDDSSICLCYSIPDKDGKHIIGYYNAGTQLYVIEYGKEWSKVYLCYEGYIESSRIDISDEKERCKPIGFAFAAFDRGDPTVDPDGFIELLPDCDVNKNGDVVSLGMPLSLLGGCGDMLQVQYGNYDGFIRRKHAEIVLFNDLLFSERTQILAQGELAVGNDLASGLWYVYPVNGESTIISVTSQQGHTVNYQVNAEKECCYSIYLSSDATIRVTEPCLLTPVDEIRKNREELSEGRWVCGIDFEGAPECLHYVTADDSEGAYYMVSTIWQDRQCETVEIAELKPGEQEIIRLNQGQIIELHNCRLVCTYHEKSLD